MSFDQFTRALSRADIEFEHLKVAQLAQAILESGRGQSALFRDFKNPFGMKYRPEMAPYCQSVEYTDHADETDQYCSFPDYARAVRGYWAFIERAPYSGWRHAAATAREYITFIAYAGYVGGPHSAVPENLKPADRLRKDQYIESVVRLFPEAEDRLRMLARPVVGKLWKAKGVYLDVGHGNKPSGYDPGAIHNASRITEHSLNLIAARACSEVLLENGIPCRIDDANVANYEAGTAAANYDVLVSIHHNATDNGKRVQASEAYYHAAKGTGSDRMLSSLIAEAMAEELGIENRGAKPNALAVLSGARAVNVRAASLAELYFIHVQTPANPATTEFTDWSRRGGMALGRAITAWLEQNN
jgi:N-acetylmuramoyl-L-alanine amidase